MDKDYIRVNDLNDKVGWFITTDIENKIRNFLLTITDRKADDIRINSRRNDGDSITISSIGQSKGERGFDFYFAFSLSQMPGNCGILVSHNMSVNDKFQGKGLAQFLQEIKEEIARLNGYTQMYCTTISINYPQNHILEKCGWKKVNTFVNLRTGNTCFEWIKEVKYG